MDQQAQDKFCMMLGLAQRAGRLSSGSFAAEQAINKHKARLLIAANDASNSTLEKVNELATNNDIPLIKVLSKDILGHAIGKDPRAIIAVCDRGFAKTLLSTVN